MDLFKTRFSGLFSVGDAAHAVGVDVRRHGLGQREAVGYTLEGLTHRLALPEPVTAYVNADGVRRIAD